MRVEVKCPRCGKPLSIELEHATWEIRCRKCSHYFVPVEDSEVPCPGCGAAVVMPRGVPGRKVTCLACGFDFRGTGRRPRKLLLGAGAGILAVLVLLFLVLGVGSGRWRGGCFGWFDRRSAANENAAIATLRTMCSAEEVFCARFGNYATLNQLANAQLIDPATAGATHRVYAKSGYYYKHKTDGTTWCCTAIPAAPGLTGSRSFFIGTDGVIYYAPCETESDPPADSGDQFLGIR